MKNNNKIIFTDLDGTLVFGNLEREFLIYLFTKYFYKKPILISNALFHFFYKFYSKVFGRDMKYKFFYYLLDEDFIEQSVNDWLSLNQFELNNNIVKHLLPNNLTVVLTSCPNFIARPFIIFFLNNKIQYLFSTKILRINGRFHFIVLDKVSGERKQRIVEKFVKGRDLYTVGFGDSPSDSYFLDLCTEKYLM